jgi:spore coat protein H
MRSPPRPRVSTRASAAPAPARPPRCGPTIGGPSWVEEGETLTAALRCASGLEAGPARAIDPLPRGATFDAATGQLSWRPGLDQAGVYRLTLRAHGEAATTTVGVADRFDDPANVPVTAPAAYAEEMGLPVLHLSIHAAAAPHEYAPATVVFRGHVYRVRVKVRGRSSLDYPKRNYTIKFHERDRFSEPAAGMTGRRKIALTSTFDDNSQLRQRLAFEVWNRLAPGGIQIRHFSAVVFLDGRYHGLYAVTDHVDTDLLEQQGLSPRGALFRALDHDAGFAPGPFRSNAFEKRSGFRGPAWLGSFSDLASLHDFIAGSDPARFRAGVGARLALGEYQAWLIAGTAMQAEDSLAKNAFHHRDPATGRWRVVPWDFNQSWGQDWLTGRDRPDHDPAALVTRNHLFARLWEDPALGADTRARYARALHHEMGLPVVRALVDRLAAEVAPGASRDERRWRAQYLAFPRWRARSDFTDFPGELAYLRRWIEERWSYLLARYGSAS